MPHTKSSEISISYDDRGQGEPALLFTPGWCATKAAFGRLPEQCSAHRRTLALDWRGHADSGAYEKDFGNEGLLDDALAVISESTASQVIPVALAHSGWIAIELRRRLANRIPKIVLLNWIVTDPPPAFLAVVKGLQDPQQWKQMRDRLFSLWLEGVDNPEAIHFVRDIMGAASGKMWQRSGREIGKAYAEAGNPLRALAALTPHLPVLHLCQLPADSPAWTQQEEFARSHPWFEPRRLNAHGHFAPLEIPGEMARLIEAFVAR
ncbi:MAG TPA: alpha/beta hydrolase [Candidatus Dormibacteraeota bacterium]|nr:alpha/beta hydrolase [Candidatus Dormibacteraeota bacterium]